MANTMRILGAVLAHLAETARRPVVLTFSFAQPIMWLLFFGFFFIASMSASLCAEFLLGFLCQACVHWCCSAPLNRALD
jgi:hypothetical protein